MLTNAELFKSLRHTGRANFYLCDLHVHSPASFDVRRGQRFDDLSQAERALLENVPEDASNDPVSYEQQVLDAFPVSDYYDLLIAHRDTLARRESICEGEDWAYVAITDHNVCSYATSLAMHAWEQRGKSRLVVLPGLELDVSFPVSNADTTQAHIILLYAPGSQPADIRVAIHGLAESNWDFGQIADVPSLPDFINGLRTHSDYPAIAIAAHVASGKGIRGAIRVSREADTFSSLEAAIARTSAELERNPEADTGALTQHLEELTSARDTAVEQVSTDILKLIGLCGFDGLQVSCKQDESHYRRLHRFHPSFGRAIPLVASDAHRVDDIFVCDNNIPYLKLPVQSTTADNTRILSLVRSALRYGETRFSYTSPGRVAQWIAGVEISPDTDDASHFWPFKPDRDGNKTFVLPLSRNLNCLVGGRGSGKSAAIDALAFVAKPDSYAGKRRKQDGDTEDWYGRSQATLSGCQVRLVWQIPGSSTDLPKGALFASRYFDPSDKHSDVTYSNFNSQEMMGSAVTLESPQIFRTREIEEAAAPKKLRALFDELVGEQIPTLEDDIADLLNTLATQRQEMVQIAYRIMELTQDDSPLLEYCRRQIAYEAANRDEVKPFYKHLDEAEAAESIARDAKERWDAAVTSAGLGKAHSALLASLDGLSKKIKVSGTEQIKPFCNSMAKLFVKDADGVSPMDRLAKAFKNAAAEVAQVERLLKAAVKDAAAEHKKARELLVKKGLPAGAKDREAKKIAFEEAKKDLEEYRELCQQWQEAIGLRNRTFDALVEKCRTRTDLRKATADRLTAQLEQDLDSSILVIKVEVHPLEDRIAFRQWPSRHIGPCIPKFRDARIDGILDKGVMPKQMRSALLGETADGALLFTVEKAKASDGHVDAKLAEQIISECSGRIHMAPEHTTLNDKPSDECVKDLPPEIRDGLWTFPQTKSDSDTLIVASVLSLDEVVFDDRPEILLNDRPQEKSSILRPIAELSPGQRCSAILPILLLNGRSPLIIDQPEDNLDNRLIRQVIVNILASIKLRRQVILATHNPNLPVLGDVEQAIVLRAIEEKQAELVSSGDLDSPETVAHLTEIMEGGREAFQYRQSIYQTHWAGPVATE